MTRDGALKAIRAILDDLSDADRADVLSEIATPVSAREKIEHALASTGGNITRAALVLKCSRRTLFNKMRQLGMPNGGKGGRKTVIG